MYARVLGPLEVEVNGIPVTPTAPKPRKVLALLALHANRVIPTRALKRELWSDTPPKCADTTLQTYILLLRKHLAQAYGGNIATAKAKLVTYSGGYVLRTSSNALDLHAFERLCIEGRQAIAAEDYEMASSHLKSALALWRGPALVDVQVGPLLEVEAKRLQECWIGAVEQSIEVDLRLGRHHEVVGELTRLVSEFPLHENLHAQLMLALYRSGRKSYALQVYREMRNSFIDELGLDPSPRIRSLHEAIIASEPSLDSEPASGNRLPFRRSGLLPGAAGF